MTPQLAPKIVVLLGNSVMDVTMQLTPRLRGAALSLAPLAPPLLPLGPVAS